MQILTCPNSLSATLAFQTFVQKRNKVIAKKSPYGKNPPIRNRPILAQYCKRDIYIQAVLLTYPHSCWSAYFLIRLLEEKKLSRGRSHL